MHQSFFWIPIAFLLATSLHAAEAPAPGNLLLNPEFRFHNFENSRNGDAVSFRSGAIACWDQENYGDVEAYRGPRAQGFRPRIPVDSVAVIHPGKHLSQFALLAETGLDPGDHVSLSVFGHQLTPGSLQAAVHLMRLDSATGQWCPADYGQADKRSFPRHARGELVKGPSALAKSGPENDFELKIENTEIIGAFTESADQSTDQPNTIGILVEFTNLSPDKDVSIYSPCLSRSAVALNRLPEARPMPEYYRGIPRTIQKLWRGEPLHILVMGSSIDRGSANPPQYCYDESPLSPTYKQPLGDTTFDGARVGHPEWNDYIGEWRHYFMYGGRLRRALMQKFNYPIDKLLLNTMACDGSSISESHSGFADYASLSIPPDPERNGHHRGKSWQELYPGIFSRPEGPRPDLVIFGSGANEKIDGADETAVFEGAIRWFQRHYPDTEFLFCMWQNRESYTARTGSLMELALRYQIPYIDFGRLQHLTTRYCNSYALVPRDGHPQAAGHYLWFKQLERAFDAADPIASGIAQKQLPERINPYTIGWEGEMRTYLPADPRFREGKAFLFDDTAINLWATTKDERVGIKVDGQESTDKNRHWPMGTRDVRNSTFAVGRLSLGDRHIVEVTGTEARLTAVDAKTAPDRQWIPVSSPRWQLNGVKPQPFASQWGEPYGNRQVFLAPGQSALLETPGTLFSIAYADQPNGGTLRAAIDDREMLNQPTNIAFTDAANKALYMEDRKGIGGLPYGMHRVRVTAQNGPVALLGVFSYDTRANRENERIQRGTAYPGETIQFACPYQAPPLLFCTGGLQAESVTASAVRFNGNGPGGYEAVGE